MAPVAWTVALMGGLLAFALTAGSAAGLIRRIDFYSALAVTPLPVWAIYLSAPELLAAVRAGASPRELIYPGGPCVIGCATLLGVLASLHQQTGGGRRTWS